MKRIYCDNCEAELGGEAPIRIDEVRLKIPNNTGGYFTDYLTADLCSLVCASEWFAALGNDRALAPLGERKEVV